MKWMIKLRVKIKYMKVKQKIILGVTSITIFSFLLSLGVTFGVVTQQMVETANEQVEMLNNQYAINLENSYYELSYQIVQCLHEAELQDYITEEKELTEYEKKEILKTTCSKYGIINKYVNYISVQNVHNEVAFWSNTAGSVKKEVYLSHLENAEKWLKENVDIMILVKGGEISEDEILLYTQIVDMNHLNSQGIAIFSIQPQYFIESLKWDVNEDDYTIIVENELNEKIIEVNERQEYKEEDYWSNEISVPKLAWNIKLLSSKDDFYHQTSQLKLRLSGITILVILIGYYFFGFLIDKMTRSIHVLEENMSQVEKGNYAIRIKPQTYDEIGLLSLRFNHMVAEIDKLVNTVYIQEVEKKQKEFEVLQAQINPHFLYNSLGTIKWQAKLEKNIGMYEYIDSLITLLKLSAKTSSAFISVENEMEYTEKYVIMQQYRMGNSFSVVYDVDQSCYSYMTLKFILQPIVENTIFHAFGVEVENPLITIRLKRMKEYLEFEIIDNGIGISKERLEIIYRKEKVQNGMNSVGIMNVHERIQLYFGEKYGMEIDSKQNVGTTVRLRIPIQKGETDGKENTNC